MKKLRLILGDQLNLNHSWFSEINKDVTYCMFEMEQESSYVKHHIQKIVGFFAAMRNFERELIKRGHQVVYYRIGDSRNMQELPANLNKLIEENAFEHFEYMLPDEYRLDRQLSEFCGKLSIPFDVIDTEHFLTSRTYLQEFFKDKKSYLMESFYRSIRRQYDILMDDDQPLGGKWNYDQSNRQSFKKGDQPVEFDVAVTDQTKLYDEIQDADLDYFGSIDAANFIWPVSREQSLELLDIFLNEAMHSFGKYQDAMHTDFRFLYHSRLSFALNTKMLAPLEVVQATLSFWEAHPEVGIEQIEGFIRQIIGWREYMRGVYWAHMPGYATMNFFENDHPLPSWYWTGKTKMQCLRKAITQSLETAYAHHIQRLMITGNFALLAGVDPDDLDAWYLGIYIDAIEWAEITNTRGMSQFADGGIVGTKPYISSASYINKMSNYCKSCYYDCKQKTGEKACPFNSLYWRFYNIHRDKLAKNARVSMMYRTWDKMDSSKQDAYLAQAEKYMQNIEEL
jgi:deoxyribodipyrimidine photolyase-related protein